MQTNLTLRLEEKIIEQAKAFAKQNNKSLSQIVTVYFNALNTKSKQENMPPITSSLIGFLGNQDIDISEYKKYLEDKYL